MYDASMFLSPVPDLCVRSGSAAAGQQGTLTGSLVAVVAPVSGRLVLLPVGNTGK